MLHIITWLLYFDVYWIDDSVFIIANVTNIHYYKIYIIKDSWIGMFFSLNQLQYYYIYTVHDYILMYVYYILLHGPSVYYC